MIANLTRTLGEMIEKIKPGNSAALAQGGESALDLSIKVMALVSAADGRVDEAEVKQVQEIYRERVGSLVSLETIERSFNIALDDRHVLWRDIQSTRQFEEHVRQDIFDAAVAIAAADQELHDREISLLRQIGAAMGLSPEYVATRMSQPD